jgi:hypothetical protein
MQMSKPALSPGKEATRVILDPWFTNREGWLHTWLGNTRMGKTYANNILVTDVVNAKIADICFTIDDKDPEKPQYQGTFRANVQHLKAEPVSNSNDARHIVFRGVAYRNDIRDSVDHGEVADLVWGIKRTTPKCKILLNIDEMADATNGHQDWKSDSNAQIYRKGAGVRISTTATTQQPQLCPREPFGLSQTIGFFQLDSREIAYLSGYKIVTEEMAAIIPTLERGEFVIYKRGAGGWDGKVYRY